MSPRRPWAARIGCAPVSQGRGVAVEPAAQFHSPGRWHALSTAVSGKRPVATNQQDPTQRFLRWRWPHHRGPSTAKSALQRPACSSPRACRRRTTLRRGAGLHRRDPPGIRRACISGAPLPSVVRIDGDSLSAEIPSEARPAPSARHREPPQRKSAGGRQPRAGSRGPALIGPGCRRQVQDFTNRSLK